MRGSFLLSLVCFLGGLVVKSPAAEPTYWQDVRPILRKHCTACHNEKNLKEVEVSGGLALDSFAPFAPGNKKPLLTPGKGADSRLVKVLLLKDENRRMPQGAPPLDEATVAILRQWIDTGAKEGTRPEVDQTVSSAPPRTRKLDVVLATNAVPPPNVLGPSPAKLELALKVGPLAPIAALAFSPDGKLLAAGSYGLVTIWDLQAARPVKALTNVLGAVNDLKFSPDGKLLAVAGGQPSAKGDLRLFSVGDWKPVANLAGHSDVVASVAFTADGRRLASGSFDKTVRIWDLVGHRLERELTGHSDFVHAVAFSPDGTWIASASKDRTVKKCDTAIGQSLLTFSGMDLEVLAVAVNADGSQVICAGADPGLVFFDARTGQRLKKQAGHAGQVHELALSQDGQILISAASDRTVKTWDARAGTVAQSLPVGTIVYAAALSPNGKLLAAGGFDGQVRLFDRVGMRHLATLLSLPPGEEKHDWLALTPEGFATGSDGLAALGGWRMAGQPVTGDAWKVLRQPEAVAKACQGDTVPLPDFGK